MAKTYKALQGTVKISDLFLNHEKTELFEQGSFLDLTYNFKIKSTLAAMQQSYNTRSGVEVACEL